MDLLTPSSPGGLPTLSLTTNSSWLPWRGLPCLSSALWCQYPYPKQTPCTKCSFYQAARIIWRCWLGDTNWSWSASRLVFQLSPKAFFLWETFLWRAQECGKVTQELRTAVTASRRNSSHTFISRSSNSDPLLTFWSGSAANCSKPHAWYTEYVEDTTMMKSLSYPPSR